MDYLTEREKLLDALEKSDKIVISGHSHPDGDSIGSCLALALGLKKIGKNPYVLLENYNIRFNIIPGAELIYKGEYDDLIPDTFVALDCSDPSRLGKAESVMERAETTICIDHHICNKTFSNINYLNDKASSCCELVFEIINNSVPIDKDIASALYAGIIYDTGGFRHNSTKPQTLIIASKLIEMGIPFTDIYNEVMLSHSLEEAKITAKAVEKMEFLDGYPVAYTYIKNEDLESVGATHNDLDGISHYIITTNGVEVSAFLYEKDNNEIKVSLRSKKADINKIAQMFNGGGHKLASGFTFRGTIEEALDKLLPIIKQSL